MGEILNNNLQYFTNLWFIIMQIYGSTLAPNVGKTFCHLIIVANTVQTIDSTSVQKFLTV